MHKIVIRLKSIDLKFESFTTIKNYFVTIVALKLR